MAKLIVNVKAETIDDVVDYLGEVIRQLNEGYTSGYVSFGTSWDLTGVN